MWIPHRGDINPSPQIRLNVKTDDATYTHQKVMKNFKTHIIYLSGKSKAGSKACLKVAWQRAGRGLPWGFVGPSEWGQDEEGCVLTTRTFIQF